MATALEQVCVDESVTIDGTDITYGAAKIGIDQRILQSQFETAAGRPRFVADYRQYYPRVLDTFTFALPWEATDEQSTQNLFLRKLKKQGGTHTFTPWREEYEEWDGIAGDTLFQLPRPNAAYLLGRSEVTYAVQITLGGVAQTVVMKDTVTSATTVTAGEVWCDRSTGLCKFGTALAVDATVAARYWPLYTVVVVPAGAVELTIPYTETIDLLLIETETA